MGVRTFEAGHRRRSHDSCSICHRWPAHISANDVNVIVNINNVNIEGSAGNRDTRNDSGGDRAVKGTHGAVQGYRRARTVRQ